MARKARAIKEPLKPIAPAIPKVEIPGFNMAVPDMAALRYEDQLAAQRAEQEAEARFTRTKRPKKAKSCSFPECVFPAIKDKGWCDRHIHECLECANRCAHDEKYCMVHSCQLCHRRRKIGGMCAECARGLGMAQQDHRYNAPALPDNRALEMAAAEGR